MESKIRRHSPKEGKSRRAYPLSVMLRVHCMQLFYNLSDPAMEDSFYEIESMRRFAGFSINRPIPDETTILNFQHLLEKHHMGKVFVDLINKRLVREGLFFKEGTIVDATIISAPTSTKNKSGKRAPEMHQTKKGNEWHFGMDKREEHQDHDVEWFIAKRPGKLKSLPAESDERQIERLKVHVRAKVEYPFLWIKRIFSYSKVRYGGLSKNENRLYLLGEFLQSYSKESTRSLGGKATLKGARL